ncbi:MAG: dTMP kinase [Acidobacteriota bacterium]|nr:dTMP kinase [Acidobacteriota bacterium]
MTEHLALSKDGGLFISFEGTEGSGKSTQMRLLVEHLRSEGYRVTENQEPGGTGIGKQIRRVLLDPANAEMASTTELLLMFASRAQAASEVISPALGRGDIVVSDRFTDSTLAYQGEARGLGFEMVLSAHRLAIGSLFPNVTVCVDIDVQEGLARAHRRNQRNKNGSCEDRLDMQSPNFHNRVRDGYRRIAALEPERFRIVDGRGSIAAVADRVWTEIAPRLQQVHE